MTEPMAEILKSLRDVDGVVGSFVWGKGGDLLARDLPAYLDPGVLIEVGPRLQRLYDAFESAGDDLGSATLVFAEHKLHLREIEPAFVAVLSAISVNMPALKMALSVVGRRLTQALERAPGSSEPPASTTTEPEAKAGSPAKTGSWTSKVFYRGNRVPEK